MSTIAVPRPSTRRVPIRVVAKRPTRTAPPPAGRAGSVGGLRLTRRGRLVVFCGTLLVILALGLFVGATSVATLQRGGGPATETVVVGSGESLWSIASEVAAQGDSDIREVMFQIERLNALESEFLYAGQRLRVPAG